MPFIAQQIKQARLHLQQSDPVMKRLLKQLGPFTAKARTDRFGTLVNSIISQQISTAAAATIRQNLLNAIQASEQHKSNRSSTGIMPEAILAFDLDQLRQLGISRQKATYLLDLAGKATDGTLDLPLIGRLEDQQVIDQLVQVKGIGVWTAQMFLIFSLGRMDVLPVDDLGIKNAIQRQYQLDQLPSRQQIEAIARPWRPFATVASWYLWRSLDNQ